MRRTSILLVLFAIVVLAPAGCSHDDMTTNPQGAMPEVSDIQPVSEVAGGVLIIIGTRFDQTATFDLRQGSVVKATLTNVILASGDPAKIQINGTVPTGTPSGKYQVCVTTASGTGCWSALVQIL
ncbi:MAG TPA: hypothetical protein VGH97_13370 [Thermoanaerobaculia bacterium]|jgi:hypothetical protein